MELLFVMTDVGMVLVVVVDVVVLVGGDGAAVRRIATGKAVGFE